MTRCARCIVLTLLMAIVWCGCVSAQSTATVTIAGVESTVNGAWDTGAMSIIFGDSNGNHYTETIPYSQFSTPASLAADFGAVFTRDYIFTSGLGAHASAGTVTFQLNNGASFESLSAYNPSVSFTLSASGWLTGSATSLALNCAASSLTVGQTTSCTAQINPVAATGEVRFTVSSSATGIEEDWQTAGLNESGSATASDGFGGLPPGTYTVIASYDGNNTYSPSSASFQVLVNSSGGGGSSPTLYSFSITDESGNSGYLANGNVQNYSDSVTGEWSMVNGYDSLNRLVAATQTPPGGSPQYTCWGLDDFGNRTSLTVSAAPCNNSSPPPPTTTYSIGPNNQIQGTNAPGAQVSYTYDAANNTVGNLTSDGVNQYLYDGDGRLCAVMSPPPVSGGPPLMTQYIYDAEGNRVAKGTISSWNCNTAQNGFTVTNSYVLGPGGEQVTEMTVSNGASAWAHTNVFAAGDLIATYDIDPTGNTAGTLHFHLADWLGTRRVQTDYAGNIEETCSSLSYGDQLNCADTALSTAADATEHHFTGKERDTESGNDYFGARYYASSMGRFLSPDWSAKIVPVPYAKLTDPQSLNLYAYMLNNPLAGADPDGHCGFDIGCYVSLALGVANGIQRDGGVKPYLQNVGTGILKGAGSAVVNTVKLAATGGDPGKIAASMIEPGPKALQPSNTTQAQASFATQVLLPAAAGPVLGAAGAAGEAEAAGTGTMSLFRAVGSAEADSIGSLGEFTASPTGSEFKGFFFNESDAASFGSRMTDMTGDPHSVVSAQAPTDLVNSSPAHNAATEGPGVLINNQNLPQVKPQ